ncbi:hypothetical protein BE1S17E09_45530 [Escherichia coli]|nr:hypothetical protein BE1S17E09_45530 [Escherichia coli]
MTVLHSVDFFPSGNASVAIEPRLPQADFPEHHHDFHEIVIVEHGTGIHVFNGQPYTITGGTVCFVRDHDRHLYEHTDNLCLTNVLYRSPDRFQFLAGLNQLLPQELDGQYPSHWRVNHSVLQQVRQLVAQMEQQEGENDLPSTASPRSCLCNYCSCCVKAVCRRTWKTAHHVSTCFWPGWRTILPMR